jgi:hypothetical protein
MSEIEHASTFSNEPAHSGSPPLVFNLLHTMKLESSSQWQPSCSTREWPSLPIEEET